MADIDMSIEDDLGDVAHLLKIVEEMSALIETLAVARAVPYTEAETKLQARAKLVAARVRSRLPEGGR